MRGLVCEECCCHCGRALVYLNRSACLRRCSNTAICNGSLNAQQIVALVRKRISALSSCMPGMRRRRGISMLTSGNHATRNPCGERSSNRTVRQGLMPWRASQINTRQARATRSCRNPAELLEGTLRTMAPVKLARPAFGLHASLRSVSHTSFGGCRLLSKVKRQAAGLGPLAEARQLILEGEKHRPYVAENTASVKLWAIFGRRMRPNTTPAS